MPSFLPDALLRKGFYLILIALACRLALLEFTDLIDPTESRYAIVAQEMITSHDWITPHIPSETGIEPYLGKPPLHFWLTAIAYKIFGFEEWSSRLPSFISALAILILIAVVCRKYFDEKTAITAVLIAFSSAMFFFLAGGSVIDVTLTALVSFSFIFLANYFTSLEEKSPTRYAVYASIFAALGFLTKGPVALVLIALPILMWMALTSNLKKLIKFPWLRSIGVFLLVTGPWFIISEIHNPGFLKYFFWNENIARYLFKDYGDRYGSGHVYFRGMSWIMLLAAFCPWSLILLSVFWRKGFRWSLTFIQTDPKDLLIFCWAISAPFFFMFVRQLHAMYILPAVPGMAILTARLILNAYGSTSSVEDRSFNLWSNRITNYIAFAVGLIMVIGGLSTSPSFHMFCLILVPLGFILYCIREIKAGQAPELMAINTSSSLLSLFFIAILATTPFINANRSCEDMMLKIAAANPGGKTKVEIVSTNTYSHYWASNAWENELGSQVTVSYIHPDNIAGSSAIENLLLRDGQEKRIPAKALTEFKLISDEGGWKWLQRIKRANIS